MGGLSGDDSVKLHDMTVSKAAMVIIASLHSKHGPPRTVSSAYGNVTGRVLFSLRVNY